MGHPMAGYDVMKMKAELDKEWTAKANEYLKAHGLILEVHAFYTSVSSQYSINTLRRPS